jgi:hypothetical protein
MRKTFIALALVTVVTLVAGPAIAGGKAGSVCSPAAPRASIDNTFAWGSKGSWGTPGEQLRYAINVVNDDAGCGSSTFGVSVSAPASFAVSVPSTVTVGSASSTYVWAQITSPGNASDGDYPLSVTVERGGVASPAATSLYKVYSSDTTGPKLYWMNPSDGGALNGRSTYVGFASSDDHVVRQLRLFVDGALVGTRLCDNITYECQLSYKWSIRRVRGQHSATFESTDAMGNVSSQTSTFTVN